MAGRGRGRGNAPHRGGSGGPSRGRGGRGGGGGGYQGGGAGYQGRGGYEKPGVYAPGPATVDSRLTDGSDTALVQSLSSLRVNSNELPLRPGFGSLGTPVKLRANFFPVRIPKRPLYEYDCAITPTSGTSIRRVKRRIFQLAEQSPDWKTNSLQGTVAHDHASKIISSVVLKQPLTIKVPFYDEEEDGPTVNSREYTLTISYVQTLDTSHLMSYLSGHPQYLGYDILPIISALNLILATHASRTTEGGGVQVGRNRFFFRSASPPLSLGAGLEAWRGFYSSVRPSHNQLLVNLNVCTTAFYVPGNLAVAMKTFAGYGARFTAFAKGVRIQATHLGYRKTVKSVSNVLPRQHTFDCPELGGTVSVEQYFKKKYNITLQFPNLPLVDVGGSKANLLPPEVCEILPNQPFRGKLNDDSTARMITAAAKPPNVNASAIVGSGLTELGFRQGTPAMNAFGITVGTDMTVVPGRILPAPGILYSQGKPSIDTEKASWDLRGVKFMRCGRLRDWVVCSILDGGRDEFTGPADPVLLKTLDGFLQICRNSGIATESPTKILGARLPAKENDDLVRSASLEVIRDTLKSLPKKPAFCLFILSNGDKHVYSNIKYLLDVWLDVPSTCVHAGKFRNGSRTYFSNVALKLNIKLGGSNHTLDKASMRWLDRQPTMLVGIDVTHPGPGSVKGVPSIAAVVASVDAEFAQYPASMELQESKKEMVTNLSRMLIQRLEVYQKRNKRLPERVIVYRDGVSEGQLETVVREELPAIHQAFQRFSSPTAAYKPKLVIVVCGKRHHTRFYPVDAQGADQRGNSLPGTLVDRGVVHNYHFDFFLQAHAGLQGTTRPTHYFVVHDEIGFKADELQSLTNQISYLYSRATKAVSLASPAYYADMACERGRCYIHKLFYGITAVNLNMVNADQEVMKEAEKLWHNGVSGSVNGQSMYYL